MGPDLDALFARFQQDTALLLTDHLLLSYDQLLVSFLGLSNHFKATLLETLSTALPQDFTSLLSHTNQRQTLLKLKAALDSKVHDLLLQNDLSDPPALAILRRAQAEVDIKLDIQQYCFDRQTVLHGQQDSRDDSFSLSALSTLPQPPSQKLLTSLDKVVHERLKAGFKGLQQSEEKATSRKKGSILDESFNSLAQPHTAQQPAVSKLSQIFKRKG